MTIGELNRRICVLEKQEKRDSFGAVINNWIITGRVWAKISPTSGRESLVNQQIQGTAESTITMRFYASMSIQHRVQYEDKLYEVTSVKDLVTGHRWTEIKVKEIENGELLSKTKEE